MKKRFLYLLIVVALGIYLCGCNGGTNTIDTSEHNIETTKSLISDKQEMTNPTDVPIEKTSTPIPETPQSKEVTIDEAHFPDPIFREYVQTNFDTNSDGQLSEDEIAEVKTIHPGFGEFAYVRTTKGIEYFKNLDTVTIYGGGFLIELSDIETLTHVDLCHETGKGKVIISNCPNIERCWVVSSEIQLSGCLGITDLRLEGEKNSRADLTGCNSLHRFSVSGVAINGPELDLSKCENINQLWIHETGLESVKINPNAVDEISCDAQIVFAETEEIKLNSLNCMCINDMMRYDSDSDGFLSLEEIDNVDSISISFGGREYPLQGYYGLDRFPNLESINIDIFGTGIPDSIELIGLPSLKELTIRTWEEEVPTVFKISDCRELETLQTIGVEVQLSKCPALNVVAIDALNNGVSCSLVDLSGCESLYYVGLADVNLVVPTLKLRSTVEGDKVSALFYKTNLQELDLSECKNIHHIEIVETPVSEMKLSSEYHIDYFCLNNTKLSSIGLFAGSVKEFYSELGDFETDVNIEWIY